jgi:hypothetical protein
LKKEHNRLNSDIEILKNKIVLYDGELKKAQEQLSAYSGQIQQAGQSLETDEAEQFRIDFEIDPVKAVNDLIAKTLKPAQDNPQNFEQGQIPPQIQAEREALSQNAVAEFNEISKGMNAGEVMKLNDKLLALSVEHPYITSVKTLKNILDARELLERQKIQEEKEAKEKEKGAAAFIPNNAAGKRDSANGLIDKINSASSMEEIESLMSA